MTVRGVLVVGAAVGTVTVVVLAGSVTVRVGAGVVVVWVTVVVGTLVVWPIVRDWLDTVGLLFEEPPLETSTMMSAITATPSAATPRIAGQFGPPSSSGGGSPPEGGGGYRRGALPTVRRDRPDRGSAAARLLAVRSARAKPPTAYAPLRTATGSAACARARSSTQSAAVCAKMRSARCAGAPRAAPPTQRNQALPTSTDPEPTMSDRPIFLYAAIYGDFTDALADYDMLLDLHAPSSSAPTTRP